MESLILVALGLFVGAGIVWFLSRGRGKEATDTSFLLLQNQLSELTKTLDAKLGESSRGMLEMTSTLDKKLSDSARHMHDSSARQFSETQKVMRETNEQMIKHLTEVAKGVSEVQESSKQVFTLADQLKNLEKVLTHQKQRGNLGEASLELALSNILPPDAYKLQYKFSDGEVVDAVIITKEGIISVDAKFSLDNYNRLINEDDKERKAVLEKEFKNDLKKRIDETAKYIKPKDGTLPFAIMYIPAEGIYYDLLINEVGSVKVNTRSLIDYAYVDKNVMIVSPTTFSAYLKSVLYGFRAFKIEESAKQIGKQVEQLSRHLRSYDEYFGKVGNALGTTVNHYNKATRELGKIDKDVLKITGKRVGVDAVLIDKPQKEEE